jgi:hypothetical protein
LNRRSGESGAFPANFVEEAENEAPPEQDLVKALDDFDGEGEFSFTVTFHANHAHNLTRSP